MSERAPVTVTEDEGSALLHAALILEQLSAAARLRLELELCIDAPTILLQADTLDHSAAELRLLAERAGEETAFGVPGYGDELRRRRARRLASS